MSCPDANSADAALAAAVTSGIAETSVDGATVRSHSLPDLIAAHKYLAGLCAADSPARGLRFNTLVPDGAVRSRPLTPGAGPGGLWGYGFGRWRDA